MNPCNYIITRKCAIALAIYCALILSVAVSASESSKRGAEPAKAETNADPIADLSKERDALKAQLAASQQQQIGLQQANQYLNVLAERNEMAVRLLQANSKVDDLQKQLDAEKAKVTTLEAEKAKWDEAVKKSIDAGLLKK